MFNTLRSRLWLSYVMVVTILLVVCSIGVFIGLRQSPFLSRQVANQLNVSSDLLIRRLEPKLDLTLEELQAVFIEETADTTVQVAILNAEGDVIVSTLDTNADLISSIQEQNGLQVLGLSDIATVEDKNEKEWLYKISPLSGTFFLLTASAKPQYDYRMMQDELLGPLIQAGLFVLVIAFFISLFLSKWIDLPLRYMAESADALSRGDQLAIPIQGPKEVRRLAQTLNSMSQKVTASAQSQREFIASVSHEIKTPLTSIQGFAQAILDGTVHSKKEIQKAANVILIETNRLHRLMLDLLTLARLEAGTDDMQVDIVSVKAMLQNMIDKFSILADQNEISLTLDEIPDVFVQGDGDRLAQVFSNILDNALKFTQVDGKVEITAAVVENIVLIQIKDDGIGIALDEHEKIFERFYQVDSAKKYGKKKGFGLGLAIAREIVQSHHGRIWVEKNPDKGSIFSVELPIFMNKRYQQ